MKTLLCAAVGTASHEHELDAYTVCGADLASCRKMATTALN